MARTDILAGIVPQRAKPTPLADGVSSGIYMRGGRYGELQVVNPLTTKHGIADEGSYFTCQNPTIGTGVAVDAQHTSFSDTDAFFILKNNAPVGSGIRVYLDMIRLWPRAGTQPTGVVSVDILVKVDTINRFTSTAANSTQMTPVNVNGDDSTGSVVVAFAYNGNATTVPASSQAARTVTRAHLPTGIGLVGDEYVVQFGATERQSIAGLTAAKATAPGRYVVDGAPVVFGPQQWCVIHRWSLTEATNLQSYEFELGWWER